MCVLVKLLPRCETTRMDIFSVGEIAMPINSHKFTAISNVFVIGKKHGIEIMADCPAYKDPQGNFWASLDNVRNAINEEYKYATDK